MKWLPRYLHDEDFRYEVHFWIKISACAGIIIAMLKLLIFDL